VEHKEQYALVDEQGRLVLGEGLRARLGLRPGARVWLEPGRDAILLHRPASHLAKVYVEPTNQCNLNCRTCIRNSWAEPPDLMSWEIFTRLIAGLKGFSPAPTLSFSGLGEPLTHPRILDMIRAAKELGGPVEMITNGLLLDRRMVEGLIAAGLDWLWISLDGASPETYSGVRGAGLEEVIRNLDYLFFSKANRPSPKPHLGVVIVAMKRNLKELPALVDLGIRLGAEKFLVTNVLPYTPEMKGEILYDRSVWNWKGFLSRISLPRMDADPETSDVLKQISRPYELTDFKNPEFSGPFNTCPFIDKGSTAVRVDGQVSPCLALLHSHVSFLSDTERQVREFSFGSLASQDLREIWESPDYADFRERVREFDFSPCTTCNSCEMAEGNEKNCFGDQRPTCGGCLWAQGFIQCP